MQIYQCPNCGRTYTEFDKVYYCGTCNYKLRKKEDIKEVKNPELAKRNYSVIGTIDDPTKPTCPSCGSSNISSIGVLDRAVSFSMVGFASSKLGKTHKCNHCGTTW